jgi:hypothetical protein
LVLPTSLKIGFSPIACVYGEKIVVGGNSNHKYILDILILNFLLPLFLSIFLCLNALRSIFHSRCVERFATVRNRKAPSPLNFNERMQSNWCQITKSVSTSTTEAKWITWRYYLGDHRLKITLLPLTHCRFKTHSVR